ncbi:hypothetical protein, partial [Victivallis sp. Marseille-Q1083]|uniref:hypothetical protein n=1 Tax=Victivallis sp. Marseille-Q1083 TaxID=2717288 RepID=UPI00158D5E3A
MEYGKKIEKNVLIEGKFKISCYYSNALTGQLKAKGMGMRLGKKLLPLLVVLASCSGVYGANDNNPPTCDHPLSKRVTKYENFRV